MTAAADRFDPFAVLGVAPDADAAAIRRAWRSLVRQYHPDTAARPDATDNAERLRAVNRAYTQIVDRPRHAPGDDAASLEPTRPVWLESPYPMPPRPRAGTTFSLALAFVALPVAALTLPGVPERVARIWRDDQPGAPAFAQARLDQVRRLGTPVAAAAPAVPHPAPAPLPTAAPIDPTVVAAAVARATKLERRRADPAAEASACAARTARAPGWAAHDYCTALALAAGRLDPAEAQARYATIGAAPAQAVARIDAIEAMLSGPNSLR